MRLSAEEHIYAIAFAICSIAAIGCAGQTQQKLSYSPTELRAELRRRDPKIPLNEVVVPFEIRPEDAARARRITRSFDSDLDRAKALKDALFDKTQFGLRYSNTATKTATETLQSHEGNCMSLASTFIGLARSAGLRVYYLDASNRVKEVRQEEEALVRVGHVTAVIDTLNGLSALDFGNQLGLYNTLKVMDDIEATAHFYNNRGYELIEEGDGKGQVADWARAARNFSLATRIKPNFVRAWNNLGVALSRQGNYEQAEASYLSAINKAPQFVSPWLNLGLLYLTTNDISSAIESLKVAARLDPKRPHIHYQLGLALYRGGRPLEALSALKKAIALKKDYASAEDLIHQIQSQQQQ